MDYIVTSIVDIKHSYSNKKKLVYINYEPAFALYNKELKTYSIKENETISEHKNSYCSSNESFKIKRLHKKRTC